MNADRVSVVAVAMLVAGFVALLIAWVGVSATLVIPTQVAFAVSGGIGGFALAGAGLALLGVQRRRFDAAVAQRDLVAFADDVRDVAELLAARRAAPTRTRRRRVLQAR